MYEDTAAKSAPVSAEDLTRRSRRLGYKTVLEDLFFCSQVTAEKIHAALSPPAEPATNLAQPTPVSTEVLAINYRTRRLAEARRQVAQLVEELNQYEIALRLYDQSSDETVITYVEADKEAAGTPPGAPAEGGPKNPW